MKIRLLRHGRRNGQGAKETVRFTDRQGIALLSPRSKGLCRSYKPPQGR